MSKRVSIIVGLYNVSYFLRKFKLSSIFSQNYTNWELILVDDGSVDDTSCLCDAFAGQDSRIKVIHKPNGGLGSARNEGLSVATGEYIWFYDVDDSADDNLLEKAVNIIERDNSDVVIFGFNVVDTLSNTRDKVVFKNQLIENQEQLRQCYLDELLLVKHGNGFAWNKLYRRSFLEYNNIRYTDLRIQQDEVFNINVLQHSNRISTMSNALYDYYIYPQGNTRSNFIKNRFDIYKSVYDNFIRLKNVWKISDVRFDRYLYARFYAGVAQCLRFNIFHQDCCWSYNEQKMEFFRVLNDPITKETLCYMRREKLFNAEDNIFIWVYNQKSLLLLRIVNQIFLIIRRIKHAIS